MSRAEHSCTLLAWGLALSASMACAEPGEEQATLAGAGTLTSAPSSSTGMDTEESESGSTDDPDTDEPDTDEPDTDEPDTDEPDTDEPDTDTAESESAGVSGCAEADILCEDFESGMPMGGAWIDKTCTDPNYQISIMDGALFTAGASGSSNNSCPLHYDLGVLEEFWVTAQVRIVGSEPGTEHEVTFFELGANPDADDPELRIGYRGDNSCSNSGAVYAGLELGATSGPGGEYTGCSGVVPVAETWLCLEVSVAQTGDSLEADMYLDGEDLDYLVHSQPQTTVLGNFSARYLKVGMQSYSGQFDGLLIDELSVSTTRVGCGG